MHTYELAATRTQLTLAGLNFGQQAIFSAGIGLSMMLAATEVAAGRMSVGDVVMVHGLIFQLTLPLNILGTIYNQVRQAATDLDALLALQRRSPSIASAAGAPPLVLSSPGGRVVFDNVTFGYDPSSPPLLKNLSFAVEPGQTVAIVGGSGSGKSSILRLLNRFFDPQAGSVTIDGQRHDELDLDSLRAAIGVVPQDVVLFNASLRYNLTYGCADATEEDLIAAASAAQIHDAITRMPRG